MSDEEQKLVRLSKLMSERGLCSRREADEYIAEGLVYVDGKKIQELGTKVALDARITLDPQAQKIQKNLVSVILNKPVGYVSAQPEIGYEPAIVLLTEENYYGPEERGFISRSEFEGLAVVGRLDIDSHGLLLYTQDGRIAKKVIGENSGLEKEYLVRIENLPAAKTEMQRILKTLRNDISLDGKKLKPVQVEVLNENQLKFILIEGKKRQIRRMCDMVGLKITGLKRVRIGKLKLGDLPLGKWRFVSPSDEI